MVIGTLDAKWRVRRISVEVDDILGFSPAECIGVSVLSAVHPSDAPAALSYMSTVANNQSGHVLHVRLRRRPRGWQKTRIMVCSLVVPKPCPFAFALTRLEQETPTPNAEQRTRDLEVRLRRIAFEVRAAGITISPAVPINPLDAIAFADLTARQQEVLERLMAGQRAPGIARDLFLSQSTVRNHLSAIFRQFDVHSQSQLIEKLNAIGIVSGTPDEQSLSGEPGTVSSKNDETSSAT